jgi:hypothetical protein
MAVNYSTIEIGGSYVVEEKQTGYYVYVADTKEQARKMMKHLNLGGGFDGFSPKFIVDGLISTLNNNSKNM